MNQYFPCIFIAYLISFDISYAMQRDKQNILPSAPTEQGIIAIPVAQALEFEVVSAVFILPESSENIAYHSYLRDCCQGITRQTRQCGQGLMNECRYLQESCNNPCIWMNNCYCCNDDNNYHSCVICLCHPCGFVRDCQFIEFEEDYYNDCCYVQCCFNPIHRVDSCIFRQNCTGMYDKHPDVYCCLKDENNYLISCICITPMMPVFIPAIIVSHCCLR